MTALSLLPGIGIANLHLGAGLYDVLTALKIDTKRYPKFDISYSASRPLYLPVVVDLPDNGVRLRFDGAYQRLRLIEVVDLHKDQFLVKNEPLLPSSDAAGSLMYRRVYSLFGASYPGELIPSSTGRDRATYVVSYPGIALSFQVQTRGWTSQTDHAKFLTDSGASVISMAIFEGKSWVEARRDLFVRKSSLPQSLTPPTAKYKEGLPADIEDIQIISKTMVQFNRRSSFPVSVTIGVTTAQDLVTDFGPPDSVFKRPGDMPDAATRPVRITRRRSSSVVPRSFGSTPSSISSTNTDTYDADFEEDDGIDGPDVVKQEDQYYCYFSHGFDILLGSPMLPGSRQGNAPLSVVTRIVFHGNVPGSFEFNRHRRSRWSLDCITASSTLLTSESKFADMHDDLLKTFKGVWPEKDMKEGMVIVRDWAGDSPSGSAILIGRDAGDEGDEAWGKDDQQWLKNTQLYKFPGLMFEVMHNGAISALTVYDYPE